MHAANEGEGNRTAARRYDGGRPAHGQIRQEVEEKAREAEKVLDGAEGAELAVAEEAGKQRSHGEDPAVTRKKIRKPIRPPTWA